MPKSVHVVAFHYATIEQQDAPDCEFAYVLHLRMTKSRAGRQVANDDLDDLPNDAEASLKTKLCLYMQK